MSRRLLRNSLSSLKFDYIIIDQATSNVTITGNIAGPIITNIVKGIHAYVLQDYSNNTISIKLLSDLDFNYYEDGSSATNDIKTKNVFIQIPTFYYKIDSAGTNKIKILYSETYYPGLTEWSNRNLIGRYEGYISNNKLISCSNILNSNSYGYTKDESVIAALVNGTNFRIIDYIAYNIIKILFFGYYGSVDSQAICGKGAGRGNYISGITDTLGMANSPSTWTNLSNLFGFEGIYDGLADYVDGYYSIAGDFTIEDFRTGLRYAEACSNPRDLATNISKLNSKYLTPLNLSGTNYDLYYRDSSFIYIAGSGKCCAVLGWTSTNPLSGGINYVNFSMLSSDTRVNVGSRLMYYGDYKIVD